MKKKLAIISTTGLSFSSFFKQQINNLEKENEIYLIANFNNENKFMKKKWHSGCKKIKLNIVRNINIIKDILCFLHLIKIFYTYKFDAAITITPKAGLFGILCATLFRVKVRIHYFTGQVWVTRKGLVRYILKKIDVLISKLSSSNLTDSFSQKKFLEDEKIVKKDTLVVLGKGSICGVDTNKFSPNLLFRKQIREEFNISNDSMVLIFLGRLNKDKGILDLAYAFKNLVEEFPNLDLKLMIIGPDEENIIEQINKILAKERSKIFFKGFTDQPEKYLAAADIFCLPSYREGFGMSALEAGACAVPVITSRIYGLTDAVEENITGMFHEPGNINEIKNVIKKMVLNRELRIKMGEKGRERVQNDFEQKIVVEEFTNYICSIIK